MAARLAALSAHMVTASSFQADFADPHSTCADDRKAVTEDRDVVIIGLGFSGLALSTKLRRAGVSNILRRHTYLASAS